jgi:hypothetical protein
LFVIAATLQAYGALLEFCRQVAGPAGHAMFVDYAGAGGTVAVIFTNVSTSLSSFAWATAIGGLAAVIFAAALGLRQSKKSISSAAWLELPVRQCEQ